MARNITYIQHEAYNIGYNDGYNDATTHFMEWLCAIRDTDLGSPKGSIIARKLREIMEGKE